MKIYIGFSKPTARLPLFGWLIQAIIKRPYDHAYVRFNEPMLKKNMVFQASKEMVNLYNYHTFLEYNKPVKEYLIECDDKQYKILWDYVTDSLGIPYSLKIDFGILLMKIFKFKNNPFGDNPNEEICSELAARVCSILGIVIAEQFSDIDPSGLDQILTNNKSCCIMIGS